MAFKDLDLEKKFRISGELQEFIKTADDKAVYASGPWKGQSVNICSDTKIRVLNGK